MNEPDKKVRESALQSLQVFVKKAKRRLGPHLKRIFSLWYISFYDQSQEVALLARKSFESAFPEAKREQVFKIAYKNFLHFAFEQLKSTEESLSDGSDIPKQHKEEVYDRITSGVFQGLAGSFEFVKDWPQEDQQHFRKKVIDILDLERKEMDAGEKKGQKAKQPDSYLWQFLSSKYRGRVRSSCLLFISHLLLNLPSETLKPHLTTLSPLVFNLLSEDNTALQSTLWREALFTLGKNYPQECWESLKLKATVLPNLYKSIKGAAFGAPQALYENFVKVVSVFPLYHLVDYTEDKNNKASFKERANIIRETF